MATGWQESAWQVATDVDRNRCLITARAVGYFPIAPLDCFHALTGEEGAPIFRVESREPCDNVAAAAPDAVAAADAAADSGVGASPFGLGQRPTAAACCRVTFLAPVRVLFWRATARTCVLQRADLSDSARRVDVSLELVHSDLMSKLEGSWRFELERPAAGGALPATRVVYEFAMWPKGVPTALQYVPGLMDAVRAAVARECVQLLDKLAFVVAKAARPGMTVQDALRDAAREVERAGSFKLLMAEAAAAATAAGAGVAADAPPAGGCCASPSAGEAAAGSSDCSSASSGSLASLPGLGGAGASAAFGFDDGALDMAVTRAAAGAPVPVLAA